MTALSYAVVTPVRDDAEHLGRVAESLLNQTVAPQRWVIVDNGSRDATPAAAEALATRHPCVEVLHIGPGAEQLVRGGPIVRAFHAGIKRVPVEVDVVVKLDADLSFAPEYFERLLVAFAADDRLGMASGSMFEAHDGRWQQFFGTRTSVWGAARAYRKECLRDVLPLEERMGWDGVDELKANLRGWRTTTLLDLPFFHHRREGERDGARRRAWEAQGSVAHFMQYRLSYVIMRAFFRARSEPAALAIITGYAKATLRRDPRLTDRNVRGYLRRRQRLRELPARLREARGQAVTG